MTTVAVMTAQCLQVCGLNSLVLHFHVRAVIYGRETRQRSEIYTENIHPVHPFCRVLGYKKRNDKKEVDIMEFRRIWRCARGQQKQQKCSVSSIWMGAELTWSSNWWKIYKVLFFVYCKLETVKWLYWERLSSDSRILEGVGCLEGIERAKKSLI